MQEAKVSLNTFLVGQTGADLQLTVREGATLEDVQATIDVFVASLRYARDEYNLVPKGSHLHTSNPQPPDSPPQPLPVVDGNAPGINSLSFEAETLVMEIKDGKKYFKVRGHPFNRHGVRIWDEVLLAAGINPEGCTEFSYPMTGYTAHYVEKSPGSPDKVTQLVKNG